MRTIVGLLLVSLMLGCGPTHELILYNRGGEDLGNLEVALDGQRAQVGRLKNDRVRRISWRGPIREAGYEFWEGTGDAAKQVGSCGYASDAMPGSVITYLVVFEPDGSILCRRIRPE